MSEQPKVTSWGNTFANGIGAGLVAGIAGIFGAQYGVGVVVFFSILVFPGLVKPMSRMFVAVLVAVLVGAIGSVLFPLATQWAFK